MRMLSYAILFLVLSLVAGAFGLTNVSAVTKRIAFVLFALFFAGFVLLFLFAWLVAGALAPSPATTSALPIALAMLQA
jgi:uncharacterized membrane protein YtjA (UPF0391 family)